MKTIVHTKACPITDDQALVEQDVSKPAPGPRDLQVRAVSVNPIDVKVREPLAPEGPCSAGKKADQSDCHRYRFTTG